MKIFRMVSTLLLLGLIFSTAQQNVLAQDPLPPTQDIHPTEHVGQIGPDGTWFDLESNVWKATEGEIRQDRIDMMSTGGPDDFGYTWDDSVALSWMNATDGTVVGLSGFSDGKSTGSIALPFAFKYYENTYTNLYIAGSGYVGFTNDGYWPWQPRVPSQDTPNNIIAPYAAPLNLASSGSTNRIYYKGGGIAPNRYFVVEWYQALFNGDNVTFEVILHENGDIVFQYQQMTFGSSACSSSGIENSSGLIGLAYKGYCQQRPSSNKAVRFYRPAPGARISVNPHQMGGFTHAGEVTKFSMTVRNTGEIGSDIYNFAVTSSWPVNLYFADTGLPLMDTNLDGVIDTGSLAQGSSKNIDVAIQTPPVANVGDSNTVSIYASSSLNPAINKTSIIRTAIAAQFAQIYTDSADGAMNLNLVQPTGQTISKASPDSTYGENISVIETSNGFIYFWNRYRLTSGGQMWEIYYTLLDITGKTTSAVNTLVDLGNATLQTEDYAQSIAVAPNGRIGVVWTRYNRNSSNQQNLYNIYFAVLDSSGNMVYGPTNLTNNSTWGGWNDLNIPRFYYPKISATADNRFTIAWEREHKASNSDWVDNIFYTVRDTSGGTVKGNAQYTSDAPGAGAYFESPTLTGVNNNRVLMGWQQSGGVAVAVFDSAGNAVYGPTPLGWYGYNLDAVQLTGGNILIAGDSGYSTGSEIRFAILNGNNYAQIAGSTSIDNPAMVSSDGYVSVTTDLSGHGILTWMDRSYFSRHNLYYALIDSNGSFVTPAMIFQSSKTGDVLLTSTLGAGNTTFHLTSPTTPNVDLKMTGVSLAGGPPSGIATIPIRFQNNGSSQATSVVVTATLDSNLNYYNASPAPTMVAGNLITWNLADLYFQGSGAINLKVSLPIYSAGIGTLYPINCQITSAGTEATPADNMIIVNVMESLQVFLPTIKR